MIMSAIIIRMCELRVILPVGMSRQMYQLLLLRHFYPRNAMLAQVLAIVVCLCDSLCLSVTRWYCIKRLHG